jgi:hypothetical protein
MRVKVCRRDIPNQTDSNVDVSPCMHRRRRHHQQFLFSHVMAFSLRMANARSRFHAETASPAIAS